MKIRLREYREHLEELVQERTKEIENANKELESFAYSVSHDLRAPLRGINGFTGILMQEYAGKLDSEGQRICSVIQKNATKMGQLIDDLLAFSRMGRSSMTFTEINMTDMVHSLYHEITTPETRRRIQLNLEPLENSVGDTSMIRHVWNNLLSNAVKFTGQQDPANIHVFSTRKNSSVVYCVRDNGAGFDMKYKDKLFGVFQRLHSEKQFPGTGVGLALVKRIVERHHGKVWGESRVGEGASFYFSLPAREPDADQ
ncbi:MAG: ATP-binding protein [candidate division KSB1 bacterium]|nr:ATP-binding protein [candidate division KSB1 bacterium]